MNISPRILLLATCLVFGAVPASVHAETTTHQQFVEQLQQLRQKKITVSQALADKNNALSQRAAIAYLRQNWNESAGDILEKFLPQAQGQVAVETMGALTEYRRVSALSAIREKLGKDSDYGVKTEALICLGVMGNSGDVATLIEYAKDAQYRASAEQALFG
ncbi:MAG: HEAT repeat domain-containing protein, partial [Puniceicoccales bacterium]|nr:HEAT repeat domain-containing protein [Puniceicoccales bacterium]